MDNTKLKEHILDVPIYTFKVGYRRYKLKLANWLMGYFLDDVRLWYLELIKLAEINIDEIVAKYEMELTEEEKEEFTEAMKAEFDKDERFVL